jgi:hypothetical protein
MQRLKLRIQILIAALRYRRRRLVMHVRGRQAAHLLHIGKTGGTAVKNALEDQLTAGTYDLFLHPHRMLLKDIPEGEKVFFFLRDPVSRFISGFHSRKRQGMPRTLSPWNAGEREAFATFSTPKELAEAIAHEDPDVRRKAEAAMRGIQHVRDSYWRWFGDEAYIRRRAKDILFIGHQEQLGADFEQLVQLLGFDPKQVRLPQDEVRSHRNPADVDKSMSPLAEANLRTWYAHDQRFMDLCHELIAQRTKEAPALERP